MLGTREWVCKTQKNISPEEKDKNLNDNNLTSKYLDKLLTQGKKLSQIISYIWLNQDPQTAQELDGYFKRGDDQELKKLLCAEDPETDEYQLLLKVFKEKQYLPIFDRDDKNFFNFRVAVDKFEGNISDPGPSDNGILIVTIPYPPRPEISDDIHDNPLEGTAPIKISELQEWLEQSPHNQPYFYENNPYIPSTCS